MPPNDGLEGVSGDGLHNLQLTSYFLRPENHDSEIHIKGSSDANTNEFNEFLAVQVMNKENAYDRQTNQ
jgi:hypothetical protein